MRSSATHALAARGAGSRVHLASVLQERRKDASIRARLAAIRGISSQGQVHKSGKPDSSGEETMITRRRLLKAAGATVAGIAPHLFGTPAQAQTPKLSPKLPEGTRTSAVLDALPGKKPLIKLTYRPPNYETPIEYLGTSITANDPFFVRYHLADIPQVDTRTWRLAIGSDGVNGQADLDLDALKRLPAHEVVAVCQCSGNRRGLYEPHVAGVEWGSGAMGCARSRLVVPGWTGTYWVKHLTSISAATKPFDGFWMKSAYRIPVSKFPVVSRFISQETAVNTPITEMVVNSLITSHADGDAGKARAHERPRDRMGWRLWHSGGGSIDGRRQDLDGRRAGRGSRQVRLSHVELRLRAEAGHQCRHGTRHQRGRPEPGRGADPQSGRVSPQPHARRDARRRLASEPAQGGAGSRQGRGQLRVLRQPRLHRTHFRSALDARGYQRRRSGHSADQIPDADVARRSEPVLPTCRV